MVPWVGLQCVILVVPDITHFWNGSLYILRVIEFPTKNEFLSLKIVLVPANSVDPDEMLC